MASQHQPHYISFNSGSGFTRRGNTTTLLNNGVCVCVSLAEKISSLKVKYLTVEIRDNYMNKVITDKAITDSVYY